MVQLAFAGLSQARARRLRRETGPVLDAVQPLFFERKGELAVNEQRRRGVPVESVQAKDVHGYGGLGLDTGSVGPQSDLLVFDSVLSRIQELVDFDVH